MATMLQQQINTGNKQSSIYTEVRNSFKLGLKEFMIGLFTMLEGKLFQTGMTSNKRENLWASVFIKGQNIICK